MDSAVIGFLALGGEVRQCELAWNGKSCSFCENRHKQWLLRTGAIYQVIVGFCTTGNGREKMQTHEAVTGFFSDNAHSRDLQESLQG